MFGQRRETPPHNYFPISPGAWWRPGEAWAGCTLCKRLGHGWGGVAISAHHHEAAGHNLCASRVWWQVRSPSGVSAGIKCNHHVHPLHTVHRTLAAVRGAGLRACVHTTASCRAWETWLCQLSLGPPPHLSTHCSQHTVIRTSGYPPPPPPPRPAPHQGVSPPRQWPMCAGVHWDHCQCAAAAARVKVPSVETSLRAAAAWAGLGWAGLAGLAGLGWAGLGWLGWAGVEV